MEDEEEEKLQRRRSRGKREIDNERKDEKIVKSE